MAESAFEQELTRIALTIKGKISSHDRAVLIGLALCCTPIPPITLAGLMLSTFNLFLWKNNKLDLSEKSIIWWAIIIGVFNLISVSILLLFIFDALSNHDWQTEIYWPLQLLRDIFSNIGIHNLFNRQRGTVI